MIRRAFSIAWLSIILAGCALVGDITPPPDVVTAQAVRATSLAASSSPQLESTIVSSPTAEWTETQEQTLTSSPPSTFPDLENGERIYAEKCADCHGDAGLGDGELAAQLAVPPSNLADPELSRRATLAEWYGVITEGRIDRFMPPFGSISDVERLDVAAYALGLGASQEVLSLGEQVYMAQCSACHGETGAGGGVFPDIRSPSLGHQRSAQAIFTLISNGRGDMPAYMDRLTEEERWATARFVQHLGLVSGKDDEDETQPPQATTSIGIVTGSVMNGTLGGRIPTDLEINLLATDGQAVVFSTTTMTDDEGTFSFEDLEVVPGRMFLVYADYQGVRYVSEGLHFLEGEAGLDLPLTVFESTDDDSGIRVQRLHLMFQPVSDKLIDVTQVWVLHGPADRSVLEGDDVGVIDIFLPEGFTNLGVDDPLGSRGRYVLTEAGFVDRMPVQPGKPVELVFSFSLPFSSRLDYSQIMKYSVDAVVILVTSDELAVRADGLQDLGWREMAGMLMHNYSLEALNGGDVLALRLTSNIGNSTWVKLAIGAGLFGIVLVAITLWWRQARLRDETDAVAASESSDDLQALLIAIAALDDDFEAGRISEDEYRSQRAALKTKALAIMRRSDD